MRRSGLCILAVCAFAGGCAARGDIELLETQLRNRENELLTARQELNAAREELLASQRENRLLQQNFADRDAPPLLPEGFVYAADFLTVAEEDALLEVIGALPFEEAKYKQYTARRRTVSYGSQYDFSANRMQSAPPLPAFLFPLRRRLATARSACDVAADSGARGAGDAR